MDSGTVGPTGYAVLIDSVLLPGSPDPGRPWLYVTTAVKSLVLDIPSAATSPARTVTWTGPFCGTASLSRTECAARSYETRAIFTP
jgi:hypothetical protein